MSGMRIIWIFFMMIAVFRAAPCGWIFHALTVTIHPAGRIRSTNSLTTTRLRCINVFAWPLSTWKARHWSGFKMPMRQANFRHGMPSYRPCSPVLVLYDDPMESPVKLRQTTTVTEYTTQFEALSNRLRGISDKNRLSFF
jgi:hypothetical protein